MKKLIFTLLLLSGLFAGTTAVSAGDDPSVNIFLNQAQYLPGDNMKVTLVTTPGSADNAWDIYIGLIPPDGSLYFLTFEPSVSLNPGVVLARPSKLIISESITVFDIIMPEGLPHGNWQWASVLGNTDLSKVSEISWAAFTFSESELSGTWAFQETITGNCPWDVYPFSNNYTASISQTGSQLAVSSISTGTSLNGTISGSTVTLTGTRPTDDGSTSISFSGELSGDGNTINGSGSWTWHDGDSSFTCSGNADGTMVRSGQSDTVTVNIPGIWQGSWQSSVHDISGSFSTNITQQGSVLSGAIDVPEIGMHGAALKGSVNGNTITFGDIDDKITFTGTVSGDSVASGTYVYPSFGDHGTWQGSK